MVPPNLEDDPAVSRRIRGAAGRRSRVKGRKGETEVRKLIEGTFGRVAPLNYAQSRSGGEDISFPLAQVLQGAKRLQIEIKRSGSKAYGSMMSSALAQAEAACKQLGDAPIVFTRNDNTPWRATVDGKWLLAVLNELELFRSIR